MTPAERFVVRWWARWPRSGPHGWRFARREAALTAARRLRVEYEVIDLRTNTILEFAVVEA